MVTRTRPRDRPGRIQTRHTPNSSAPVGPGLGRTADIGDNGDVIHAAADDPDVIPTSGSSAAAAPQLVIFDLDGTLTDSAQGIVSSFRHALGKVGAAVPDGDLISRIVGPPMHHTLRAMDLGERTEAAITAYYDDYTSRGWAMNALFEGVRPLLDDLSAAGTRLAVATSKAEPTALRILAHFGLSEHFEVVAGAGVDRSRAAKADVLARALVRLQPLPPRLLMVGDRVHDVEGAAAHGIDTVVVGWGYGRDDFTGTSVDSTSVDSTRAAPSATHVATVDQLREVLGV